MTKIGLIGMSGKPVHAGHVGLIEIAASECQSVHVYVSLSDRKRPGELPILGSDMEIIWKMIEPTLPKNVIVSYGGSPIRKIYDEVGKANENESDDTYVIYADPTDLSQNFPENSLEKYFGNLYDAGQVKLRAVQRSETVDVSGTKMRQMLASGNKKEFLSMLPPGIDGNKVWSILNASKEKTTMKKKKTVESIVKTVMVRLINEAKIENYGIPNTIFSDMNEILMASALMGGATIEDIERTVGADAAAQVKIRAATIRKAVKEAGGTPSDAQERISVEIRNGTVAAAAVTSWASDNGYGSPKAVYWTARPGALKAACSAAGIKQEPTPGHPADVAIVFGKGKILGVSAKATKGSGDIGFKNPGWGTFAGLLKLDASLPAKLVEKHLKKIAPEAVAMAAKERKEYLRSTPKLKAAADAAGRAVMKSVRDELMKGLGRLGENELRQFVVKQLVDAPDAIVPAYIKVTATGGGKAAHVHDPSDNETLTAISAPELAAEPVREDSIILTSRISNGILQLRVKFESQALASSIKMSAEPARKS